MRSDSSSSRPFSSSPLVFSSRKAQVLLSLVVFFWRSTAFVRIDQLPGRPTNNSAVATLDLSELISSAPFSADSSPPLTETLVVSAPAATPPSFVLSAQDLTQAFSRALGESLPHILATMQSHSKNTCASVSRFTSAGNMLSN